MKTLKSFFCLTVMLLIVGNLCACGISRDEAVGVWSGTYEYNGSQFYVTFELKTAGDYSKVSYKNGSLSKVEEGTWEVRRGKVILHEDGDMRCSTVYEYKGDALVNNNHNFYKNN